MNWLARHATALGALSGLATALIALAALAAVKFQLDAADEQQRAQSAREAFRGHLALAAGMPDFAAPADGCALLASEKAAAYTAFVDHLLYSAEQMLEIDPSWAPTFREALLDHRELLCAAGAPRSDTPAMTGLLAAFRENHCAAVSRCAD